MKIIKIVVDKLPNGCKKCMFAGDFYDMGNYDCFIEGMESVINYIDTRPDWCPLEEREHILSKDCWCNPTVEVNDEKT